MRSWSKYITLLWTNREGEKPSLHGLRAISIFGVFICHTGPFVEDFGLYSPDLLNEIMPRMSSFVDLFFILSGYLIYGGLSRTHEKTQGLSYGTFFTKRIFRIIPAYYIYLLIVFIAGLSQISHFESIENPAPVQTEYLQNLKQNVYAVIYDFLFLSNYLQGYQIHTWSIATEEQFYLVVPVILSLIVFRLRAESRLIFWLVVYTAGAAFRTLHTAFAYEGYEQDIYHFFHTRFDSIVTGILIYEFLMQKRVKLTGTVQGFLLLVSFLMLFTAHSGIFEDYRYFEHVIRYNLVNAGYGIWLIAALISEGLWNRILSWKFWIPTARLSYAMYLWHVFIAFAWFTKGITNSGQSSYALYFYYFFTALSVTYFAAVLSYIFIETPAFLIRDKLFTRKAAG